MQVDAAPQEGEAPGPQQVQQGAQAEGNGGTRDGKGSVCSLLCCHCCGVCREWRWGMYCVMSLFMAVLVVHHAFVTREQFYPAVVYLISSKVSVAVLSNLILVVIMNAAYVLKAAFLGDLYPLEVERVYDSIRFAILEVCLALTIFRAELSARVLGLFAGLLLFKAFHVLVDARMENIERHAQEVQLEEHQANSDRRQGVGGHAGFLALAMVLLVADAATLGVFSYVLSVQGHSVLMLFAFETALLALTLLLTLYRYALYVVGRRVEAQSGGDWHNRNLYLMYGKLCLNTVKLCVLVLYFVSLLTFYGMPFLMVRDLWRAFDSVYREASNLQATWRLRREVSQRFFRPTAEEVEEAGGLDPIYHTPLTAEGALKLPCGHILNEAGLMSWWERQRNCPVCRYDISQTDPPEYIRERQRRQGGGGARDEDAVRLARMERTRARAERRAAAQAAEAAVAEVAVQPDAPATLRRRRGGEGGAGEADMPPPQPSPPAAPAPSPQPTRRKHSKRKKPDKKTDKKAKKKSKRRRARASSSSSQEEGGYGRGGYWMPPPGAWPSPYGAMHPRAEYSSPQGYPAPYGYPPMPYGYGYPPHMPPPPHGWPHPPAAQGSPYGMPQPWSPPPGAATPPAPHTAPGTAPSPTPNAAQAAALTQEYSGLLAQYASLVQGEAGNGTPPPPAPLAAAAPVSLPPSRAQQAPSPLAYPVERQAAPAPSQDAPGSAAEAEGADAAGPAAEAESVNGVASPGAGGGAVAPAPVSDPAMDAMEELRRLRHERYLATIAAARESQDEGEEESVQETADL